METNKENIEIEVEPKREEQVKEQNEPFTTLDLQQTEMTPYIVDEVIDITTDTKGLAEVETNFINGYVKAILIDIKSDMVLGFDLKIVLNTLPEFAIFDERNILLTDRQFNTTQFYIPIKVDHFNINNQQYESPDYFVINEKLKVMVAGPPNYKLQIRIRYSVN